MYNIDIKTAHKTEELMKAAFFTLGCKVNQYETQIMEQDFQKAGFEIVDCESPADVYVINSCTVTGIGDKKSRQMLRHFKRNNPDAVVALTGCYPQAFPEEASTLMEADVITGATDKSALLPAVLDALDGKRVVHIAPHSDNEEFEPMQAEGMLDRTRAFVKIEDGCDNSCSYCIIPKARGHVRSKAMKDIERELESLLSKGYNEVVLSGINLPFYGRDIGAGLVDAVELSCEIMPRVRLSSLEPELLSRNDVERLSKLDSFCPQFHLSLQSGCDKTLNAMRRRYNTDMYRKVVENIREFFPEGSITTDIIVGFPGETEEDFEESCRFIEEIGFAKVHIFPYSRRSGTVAAGLSSQLTTAIKNERAKKMADISKLSEKKFIKSQHNKIKPVLFETPEEDFAVGYTENYIRVKVKTYCKNIGNIKNVLITECFDDYCIGKFTD